MGPHHGGRDSPPDDPGNRKPPISVRSIPCSEPSNRDLCVAPGGYRAAHASSTAKPWFWLVIKHGAILQVLHRVIRAMMTQRHLHRRRAAGQSPAAGGPGRCQIRGMPGLEKSPAMAVDGVVTGLRVARAVGQENTIGASCASTSAAGVSAGTTVSLHSPGPPACAGCYASRRSRRRRP